MDQVYDVIVVGMGPGGSMAACRLARHGLKVLALEKGVMPRTKLCAGALSPKGFKMLDIDISESIEQEVAGGMLHAKNGASFGMDTSGEIGVVVDRARYDHILLKRAEDAGATVQQAERVKRIIPGDVATVETNKGSYQARFIIGADGANSIVARCLGYSMRHMGYTLECFIPDDYKVISECEGVLAIYFGYLPTGYAWIFPRRGGALVGLGVFFLNAKKIREHFRKFLVTIGLPGEYANRCKGHPIPIYTFFNTKRHGRENILLIGDAACLVDPVSGEGISYAMQSGEFAAQAILDCKQNPQKTADVYAGFLKPMRQDLMSALKIAIPLNLFPRMSLLSISVNPEIEAGMKAVMLGTGTYTDLLKIGVKVIPATFKALFKKMIP